MNFSSLSTSLMIGGGIGSVSIWAVVQNIDKFLDTMVSLGFIFRREVESNDHLYHIVGNLALGDKKPSDWHSLLATSTSLRRKEVYGASAEKPELQYSIGDGIQSFCYNGSRFIVKKAQRDTIYIPGATARLQCYVFYCLREASCNALFEDAIKKDRDEATETPLYCQWRELPYWDKRPDNRRKQSLKHVYIDAEAMQEVQKAVTDFLKPETKALYQRTGKPYRLTLIFYGPPGTGKTSTAMALAGDFGLPVYYFQDLHKMSSSTFGALIGAISYGIGLIEDIDSSKLNWAQGSSDMPDTGELPLSGFLNGLDGVAAGENRIMIITTNDILKTPQAMRRPERAHHVVYFGNATKPMARAMFVGTFRAVVEAHTEAKAKPDAAAELDAAADEFVRLVPDRTLSPATLRGFCSVHGTPRDAIDKLREHIAARDAEEIESPGNGSF